MLESSGVCSLVSICGVFQEILWKPASVNPETTGVTRVFAWPQSSARRPVWPCGCIRGPVLRAGPERSTANIPAAGASGGGWTLADLCRRCCDAGQLCLPPSSRGCNWWLTWWQPLLLRARQAQRARTLSVALFRDCSLPGAPGQGSYVPPPAECVGGARPAARQCM